MPSKEKFDNPAIKFYKNRKINLRGRERSVIVKDLIKRRLFMKLKVLLLLVLFFIIFVIDCAEAQTYSLSLRYQPMKEFPSLQQKFGSTIGIAPFKDERREKSYIGIHFPLRGLTTHFESNPMPLEKALQESLGNALSRLGVKVVSVPNWDGTPESLKNIDTDSVLTIEIKKFWAEGKGSLFRANIKTTVQLVIHLGVKNEGKVFTRNADVEKEITVPRSTPERVEAIINQILSDIFDAFLSSTY
jgi:uncharacterized lipoprotein YajG